MCNISKNELTEEDRIKGSLFGFFVGDALGVPAEFTSREILDKNKIEDMIGYGTHNQPIGTWSDDSSMVIATMESLINNKVINYIDIMDNFTKWYKNGEFTPFGKVFDIGSSTLKAISSYDKEKGNYKCGDNDIYSNGNGSLMRILPISIYLCYSENPIFDIIDNISSMTHAHIYSVISCVIYTVFIKEYLKTNKIKDAYIEMQNIIKSIFEAENNLRLSNLEDLKTVFKRLIYDDISSYKKEDIKSTGYVIDTLEACFWCILKTNNYKDAALTAVNLGDDTDTIGALVGGLAGMIYGFNDIPVNWINSLQRYEYLNDLVTKFNNLIKEKQLNKAIYTWQNTLGDFNKMIFGENPMPSKKIKATKDSWKTIDLKQFNTITSSIILKQEDMEVIKMGHIPEVMEDHWFMYCDNNTINYYRSWSGIQIFKAFYRKKENYYEIYKIEINNDKNQYKEDDITKSLSLFHNLIYSECK